MARPRPTKQLILDMTGGNKYLISCLHHGLRETPLIELYPHLNFDEAVVFAAETWRQRDKEYAEFRKTVDYHGSDFYGLFNEINKSGFAWINKNKDISDKLKSKHKKMNPFKNNLRERLERIEPGALINTWGRLEKETDEYVLHGSYHHKKAERGGDNYGLETLDFLPSYKKDDSVMVGKYATKIAQMFRVYPQEFVPFEKKDEPKEEPKPIVPEDKKDDGEGTPMYFGFAEE